MCKKEIYIQICGDSQRSEIKKRSAIYKKKSKYAQRPLAPLLLRAYTKDNSADLASRGCTISKFVDNQLWWHGPSWLNQPESKWPVSRLVIEPHQLEIINSALKKSKPVVLLEGNH